MIFEAMVRVGNRLFRFDELKRAYHKTSNPNIQLLGRAERAAYLMLRAAGHIGILNHLRRMFIESKTLVAQGAPDNRVYDEHYLNLKLNRIFDLPDVEIDAERPPTINVL